MYLAMAALVMQVSHYISNHLILHHKSAEVFQE